MVFSKTENATKSSGNKSNNYSTVKLEMLRLKWAVTEQFWDLLGKYPVVVPANISPIGGEEMRWAADLAQFQLNIKYRSGKANSNEREKAA